MAGYDFNVTPVQVEGGADYQARRDAAAARKQELQQRQIQLDEAKRQQAAQANQRAAVASAYQPQSYTPPAQGLDVGGASLGYQPAQVQGPAQFNRGSYLSALQKTDPMGAMQAQQGFQQSDQEQQMKQAQLQEALTKADSSKLSLTSQQLELTARMLGAVRNAPPELQAQVYQGVRQKAIQAGVVQPNDPNVPEQYMGPQWVDQQLNSVLPVKDQIDNEIKRREQDVQMRGQDMTAATAKAGQAVTVRGQNMVDARAKESNVKGKTQLMEVPQPDGTKKLVEVAAGDSIPLGAKTPGQADKPPSADEQRRADLANNMDENLTALEDIARRRPELFGPMAGRLTGLKQAAGSSDPDVASLKAIKEFMGMAAVGTHAMRNAQHVEAAANSIINGYTTPASALLDKQGPIARARQSIQTFKNDANRGASSGGGTEIHYKIVNGQLVAQ